MGGKSMRIIDKTPKVSRRRFLASTGAATVIVASGAIMSSDRAWGLAVKNLKPETMRTLVQMARDIYPHDRFSDAIYAGAVKGYDDQAGKKPNVKDMLEDGVTALNEMAQSKHGSNYVDVGWEIDRVALLRAIENGKFFQTIRGGLVTGIYNNPDVWNLLGYEGESASKGGYLERGFDDIAWL